MNSKTNIDSMEEDGDYLISVENIVLGKLIGAGQFGSVYVGKYFGDFVAVKSVSEVSIKIVSPNS